ncbi:hypothetical protein ACJJTC_003590 [Scirpophaga incertulas]
MAKEKEREAWTETIDLFWDLSYLWDKKHKEYFNRDMRQKSFKMLLQLFNKETGKNTTLAADFKKKLENMRTTYGRELKKVNASKQTGSGSNDIYVPSVWYYRRITVSCFSINGVTILMNSSKHSENILKKFLNSSASKCGTIVSAKTMLIFCCFESVGGISDQGAVCCTVGYVLTASDVCREVADFIPTSTVSISPLILGSCIAALTPPTRNLVPTRMP